MDKKKKVIGIRSINVFIPAIAFFSVLYALILISTILIDNFTEDTYNEMITVNRSMDDIMLIQSRSSKMTETITDFLYCPTVLNENTGKPVTHPDDGMEIVLIEPLNVYFEEKEDEFKAPDAVVERIKEYKLDQEVYELVDLAVKNVELMEESQRRAVFIINAVSSIEIPAEFIDKLEEYELTDEEKAMTDDEKRVYAFSLVMSRDYTISKSIISDSTRKATKILADNTSAFQKSSIGSLKLMRGLLWLSIALILLLNIMFFFVLLKRLIFPITRFARSIDENERLTERGGLYEANYLAIAYNSLLDRHKEFDDELRTVAEIDSLTNLPNRYCYNEFLKETPLDGESVCIILFDINNLKYVNDTFGHSKGDELIKNASICISDCFLSENGKNCYRIGGDEFVAVLKNVDVESVEECIAKFKLRQEELNVSIAVGYEYAKNIVDIGYEKLFIEADLKMYENKNDMKTSEDS